MLSNVKLTYTTITMNLLAGKHNMPHKWQRIFRSLGKYGFVKFTELCNKIYRGDANSGDANLLSILALCLSNIKFQNVKYHPA